VLDKLASLQMLDVHFPTTDGRELIFTRHTEPRRITSCSWRSCDGRFPASPARITAKRAVEL